MHVVLPARFFCPVPAEVLQSHELWEVSVVADAVSTPFTAIESPSCVPSMTVEQPITSTPPRAACAQAARAALLARGAQLLARAQRGRVAGVVVGGAHLPPSSLAWGEPG